MSPNDAEEPPESDANAPSGPAPARRPPAVVPARPPAVAGRPTTAPRPGSPVSARQPGASGVTERPRTAGPDAPLTRPAAVADSVRADPVPPTAPVRARVADTLAMPAWVAPPAAQPVSSVADTVAMPVLTDADAAPQASRVADTVAMPVVDDVVLRGPQTVSLPPTAVAGPTMKTGREAAAVSRVADTVAMPTLKDEARRFSEQDTHVPDDAPAHSAPVLVRHRAAVTTRRDSAPDVDVGAQPFVEPPATRPRTSSDRAPTVTDSTDSAPIVPAGWRFGLWSAACWLLLALALPTASAPPWKLLVQPTGVAFHALMLLLLIIAVGAAGLAPRAWRTGVTVIGVVALGLVWLVMRDVVALDQFDAQPGMTALWQGAGVGGVLAVASAALLGGAALARARVRRGVGPLVLGVVGLALGVLAAVGIGMPSGYGLGAALDALGGSPFQGDRVGSVVLILSLGAVVVAFVASFPGMPSSFARIAGWTAAATAVLPAIILATFVASETGPVLAPLKAAAFLAGCIWLATTAFGSWFNARP